MVSAWERRRLQNLRQQFQRARAESSTPSFLSQREDLVRANAERLERERRAAADRRELERFQEEAARQREERERQRIAESNAEIARRAQENAARGPGFVPPTAGLGASFQPSLEDYASAGRMAAQAGPAALRVAEEIAFGPERQSVLGGEASRAERTLRDWGLSEQEFRAAGEAFGGGRPLAGLGWGALGLAGAIPGLGQFGRGVVGVARGVGAAADAARATNVLRGLPPGSSMGLSGSVDDVFSPLGVARPGDRIFSSLRVARPSETIVEPLLRSGNAIPLTNTPGWQRESQSIRNSVLNSFGLQEIAGDVARVDASDAQSIFEEIFPRYQNRFISGASSPDLRANNIASSANRAVQEEMAAEIAARLGRAPYAVAPPLTREVANNFVRNIENLDVTIATNPEGLQQFVQSGRLQNAFESGQSGSGSWFPEFRMNAEQNVLGIPMDAAPSQRPVYGYLSYRPGNAGSVSEDLVRVADPRQAQDYGEIRLRFAPSVNERSTFTMGDSIRNQYTAVPLSNPSFDEMVLAGVNRLPMQQSYMETQIFGAPTFEELVGIDVPARLVEQVRSIVGDSVTIYPY
jgi:hypothetical protein